MAEGAAWVRIKGDGLAVEWPCLVTDILWFCRSDDDTLTVYDGLDATGGKPFMNWVGGDEETIHLNFGEGIEFSHGVYVDQTDAADVVTIGFRQVE